MDIKLGMAYWWDYMRAIRTVAVSVNGVNFIAEAFVGTHIREYGGISFYKLNHKPCVAKIGYVWGQKAFVFAIPSEIRKYREEIAKFLRANAHFLPDPFHHQDDYYNLTLAWPEAPYERGCRAEIRHLIRADGEWDVLKKMRQPLYDNWVREKVKPLEGP